MARATERGTATDRSHGATIGGAGERLAGAHALARLPAEIRTCARRPHVAHRTLAVPVEGNVHPDVTPARLCRAVPGRHILAMYHPAAALHQASLRDTRSVTSEPAGRLAGRLRNAQ